LTADEFIFLLYLVNIFVDEIQSLKKLPIRLINLMKKLLFTIIFVPLLSFAQNGFNYQSLIKDANGAVLTNTQISLKFSILYDSSSGTPVYVETHGLTTPANGVVNLVIGSGTATTGSFSNIDWSKASIYLKREVDIANSGTYTDFGTALLYNVPKANYSSSTQGISYNSSTVSITNLNVTNTITATAFVGDGSGLTNLTFSSIEGIDIETSGNLNIAIGKDAFGTNGSGVSNVAIGERSMSVSNTSGSWNVALGAATMIYNSTGDENTAVGSGALEKNTSGNNNSALGHWALNKNISGIFNTALGWEALSSSTITSANTAIGSTALKNITGGQSNVAIGSGAIEDATSGDSNIAIGVDALHQNSVGSSNVAIGARALFSNTGSGTYDAGNGISWSKAFSNVAIGYEAMYANTTGSFNTAVGESALRNAVGTINNVAIGVNALKANTSGWDNTALGAYTLMNTTTSQGVAIGSHSLRENTTGFGNTALGSFVLYQNTTGNHNTALGYQAGYNTNTDSNLNTLVGYKADTVSGTFISNATAIGANATVTTSNTIQLGDNTITLVQTSGTVSASAFVGDGSGLTNLIGSSSVNSSTHLNQNFSISVGNELSSNVTNTIAVGKNTMLNSTSLASRIVAIGSSAMENYLSGSQYTNTYADDSSTSLIDESIEWNQGASVAIGYEALKGSSTTSSNTANWNTAVGYQSMKEITSGRFNTGLGGGTLQNNKSGSYNSAVGDYALIENKYGNYNTAIGSIALRETGKSMTRGYVYAVDGAVYGDSNTALGFAALQTNDLGNFNTAVGAQSLRYLNSGDRNVALGFHTFYSLTSGSYNTAIGDGAGYPNTTVSNVTLIGATTRANDNINNSTAIGANAFVTTSNTIQLGDLNVEHVKHYGALSASSDRRLKENIVKTPYGLEEVLKLNPVTYRFKSNGLNQIGFIAQEVQPLLPEVVTGTEGDIEKGETLGITYSSLIPVLTKAIQEQQQQLEAQQKQIQSLIKRLEAIENK
jgi:trimeric autotransporter adhesin